MKILSLNTGSSSIKATLYDFSEGERVLFAENLPIPPDQQRETFLSLFAKASSYGFDAIGHRLVHGGPLYTEHQLVTKDLIKELKRIAPFDPLHMPNEIEAIELCAAEFPNLPQVACFDTVFHSKMPEVAKILPIPEIDGVRKYGFHGLSYEYIVQEIGKEGRIIIAHLGSGASMAAVDGGNPIDTTMGFTPTGGLVMGTRSGDLDPGLLLYLLRGKKIPSKDLSEILNFQSGLKGISDLSGDMETLLASDAPKAKLAVEKFCYEASKWIGAFIAILGGLDTLVFTAGIGENSPVIRETIVSSLSTFGISIDPEKNEKGEKTISNGSVKVLVVPTDEQLMIARHTKGSICTSAN